VRKAGRTPIVPEDPGDALAKLLAEGDIWRRRCEVVTKKLQGSIPDRSRKRLQKRAAEATKELEEIAKTARKAAREIKALS